MAKLKLTQHTDGANARFEKTQAKVVSAGALTKEQIESIRIVLSKKLDMPVEVSVTIEPELIGGFYVLANGRIFDGTVRTDLNRMKRMLEERKL